MPITASDIKHKHAFYNPDSYFFDRSSMRFFGDTMRNYYAKAKPVMIDTYSDNLPVECYHW